jgi:prolyl-tRNA editing enzyme YbaK/EbsC (Cys-tRNA(Pro) deacylase)
MHPSAQRVQTALAALGYTGSVLELEASTRTAVEAAQAAGCEVGQIVKSLGFLLITPQKPEGEAVLVLVSGSNRVHEKRLGRLLGGKLERAPAELVHQVSGFAIGGVPPVGHKQPLRAFLDEDLLQYPLVYAAAGTPNALFPIEPAFLRQISAAEQVCVT